MTDDGFDSGDWTDADGGDWAGGAAASSAAGDWGAGAAGPAGAVDGGPAPGASTLDAAGDGWGVDAGGGGEDAEVAAAAAGTAVAADGAAAVADEVESYVEKTLAEFRRMFSEYRYGSYCGPGGSGTPIDDIDTCCETHDHAYTAVGQSGSDLERMFSAAGVVATEAADSALVGCLNATITGPTWHDPAAIAYREAAIAIFGARAAAAAYVRSRRG
jgi:phospholipase A2-like protein